MVSGSKIAIVDAGSRGRCSMGVKIAQAWSSEIFCIRCRFMANYTTAPLCDWDGGIASIWLP